MTTQTRLTARHTLLLNGWWDFQPVPHADLAQPLAPADVPETGWQTAAFLVPGFFTEHAYPAEWRQSRSGWMRTRFLVNEIHGRAYLTLGAAIPQAWVFVNGWLAGVQDDMFLGEPIDVTGFLGPGENELAVFLTEFRTFPHPHSGKLSLIDVPWGCCIAQEQAGIWQDVQLEWRPAAHVTDVTIRTSVREQTLTVITKVENNGLTNYSGVLAQRVEDGDAVALVLDPQMVTLAPGESKEITQCVPWSRYRAWSPDDPYLYHLVTEFGEDTHRERFGFREV